MLSALGSCDRLVFSLSPSAEDGLFNIGLGNSSVSLELSSTITSGSLGLLAC